MKILQVNKFHWLSGGVERYMFELSEMLERHGHEICYFAMSSERNRPSSQSRYFVSNIEYRDTSAWYKARTLARTVGKTVYSFESKSKLDELIRDERPDIAHLHMIDHQISPSILHVFRRHGIPVVQTVHEYKLVCPSYHLYIHHKNEICERCLTGNYYNAVLQRCLKGSLAASTLAAAAQYFHKALQIYERNVDRFIAPSRFMASKLIEGGVPEDKIRVLPNQIGLEAYDPDFEAGDYMLYIGRLSPEKGILTLLRAMQELPGERLVIAGTGPQKAEIEAFIGQNGLDNVSLAGFLDGDALKDTVRRAAAVVLPSECYENAPLAVLEAYALGKPVVGARIGGIPELIREGETGWLFEPGNVHELASKLGEVRTSSERLREMGQAARRSVEEICAGHYERLLELYEEARQVRNETEAER